MQSDQEFSAGAIYVYRSQADTHRLQCHSNIENTHKKVLKARKAIGRYPNSKVKREKCGAMEGEIKSNG